MSSSPSPLGRPSRVIRRPVGVLPAAVVASRGLAPAGPDSATSLESLLDAARQEALEEGLQAGRTAAAEEMAARRASAVAATAADLSGAAAELAALRAEVLDEVVQDVVELAFELVEVLVGRELALSESPGRDAVARALALVPEGHDLVVRVHSDSPLTDEEVAVLAGDPAVQVVRDPSVDPEGCEVTIGACHVDAQVRSALARVRHCLEGARPSRPRRRPPAPAPFEGDAVEFESNNDEFEYLGTTSDADAAPFDTTAPDIDPDAAARARDEGAVGVAS